MKKTIFSFVMMITVAGVSGQQVPSILQTSPKFWETGVNPSLKSVSITFDQSLRHGFSSWLGKSSLSPTSQLESANSEDGRTFTLTATFEPGKVYVFALNEKRISGVGFQSKRGVPLPAHFLVFQTAGSPSPDDSPPRIVRSIPVSGDQQVDPARTKAIVLSFDKAMQTDKHGLHLFDNNQSVDLSKARSGYSADGRTFTLYYDFKPSTPYRLELNSVNDIGFATANKVPLWPVQIAFTTGQH